MNKATLGLLLALLFISLEAVQTVYFGGLFQHMSAFMFGALVFGATVILSVGWAWLRDSTSLTAARRNPVLLIAINICALMTFGCFLMSVQLIEPAITYTISCGTMPIATWAFHKLGVKQVEGTRNTVEAIGLALLLMSVIYLGTATIGGQTGFVRGDSMTALLGVLLAIADGTFFTLILILSKRLDDAGVSSFAVLGLRLPFYVLVASAFAVAGVDAKEPMTAAEVTFFAAVGFLLTTPPLYFLQKAVALISTLTISSLTSLGPFLIFAIQMLEGRVQYSNQTLLGITLYAAASILCAFGAVQSTRSGSAQT